MDNTSADCTCAFSAADRDGVRTVLPPAHVCPECQTVIDQMECLDGCSKGPDEHNHDYEGRHFTSWSELKASSSTGCGFCSQVVIASSSPYADKNWYKPPDTRTGWVRAQRHYTRWIIFQMSYPSEATSGDEETSEGGFTGTLTCPSAILIMIPTTQPAELYGCKAHIGTTMGALPLCRRWLQECCQGHEECVPDKKFRGVIPTRLVDIGLQGPRLQLADELQEGSGKVTYATLSHCWGSTPFTTLTSANLTSFRRKIPYDALTKTFLDAIHIARAMGFGYLWIDSLCIIQDSPEDWERESALMEDVYGASSLTIAATSAEDGSVGCFFDRTPDWRHQILQRQSKVLWDVFAHGLFDPKPHALSKRAWALQERWLSRRTLHFTRHQVFWECDGNPASETYPQGYPPSFKTAAVSKGFLLERRPLTVGHWSGIVEDYSLRFLTKMSDTLPAISGIAKMIHEQSQDDYIAGMWREGLEDQLLWHTWGSPRVSRKHIAPSWSWASVSGELGCYGVVARDYSAPAIFHVTVHDISIQHLSENPFGEIAGASLRLGCEILWPGVVRDAIWRDPDAYDSPYQATSFVFSDVDIKIHFSGAWASVDDTKKEMLDDGYLLDIFALPVKHGSDAHSWRCDGLLLQPTGRTKGQYRRVGMFGFWDQEKFNELVDKENLVARDSADHFVEVLSENGVKQYIIELV